MKEYEGVNLMRPGEWNNQYYSKKEIEKAFKKTNWGKAKDVFIDFEDRKFDAWIGYIENPKIKNGCVTGNFIVLDTYCSKIEAMRSVGIQISIAPKIKGDIKDSKLINFAFENFALCLNPSDKGGFYP